MRKNDQSIYLWSFFIVSAIVLSFLYTPIGGKLNNGSDGYYIETAPPVNFGGRIANSPKGRTSYQSHSPSANDAPQAVNLNNYMSQRPVVNGGAIQNSNMNAGNSYSAKGLDLGSTVGAGSGGSTSMMAVSGGGKSQSSGNDGGAGGGGGGMMAPFSNDGISTGGPMKAISAVDEFPVDPGAEPTGDPIPIGDGTWVLLLFAGIYIIIKKKAKL